MNESEPNISSNIPYQGLTDEILALKKRVIFFLQVFPLHTNTYSSRRLSSEIHWRHFKGFSYTGLVFRHIIF